MKYIVKDPTILAGTPVVIGTRIPAERLAWLMDQGFSAKTLQHEFPQVDLRVLRGAAKEVTNLAVVGINSL